MALTPTETPQIQGKLVAWWKFDETEGEVAGDSSGNNHGGTLVGGPQWMPDGGKTGGALQFDGVDDYVETNYSGNLPVWTAAAWVKGDAAPDSQGPGGPVHWQKNLQINWDHHTGSSRGTAGTMVADTWYHASFGYLEANTWYHLAATYDGESLKAYKNSVLITKTPTSLGNSYAEKATLKIGRHAYEKNPANHFAGVIDDVRIYDYPLSEAEVAALYSGQTLPTVGHTEPGPSSNWIPVSIIVIIAVLIAAVTIRKKKTE